MSTWSLVMTAPHRERGVAKLLGAFAIPFHLFHEKRQQVWRGRIVEKLHPVFPGYIFVAAHGVWDLVRSIAGVIGFVQFEGRIAPVDDRVVDGLIQASVNDVLPFQSKPIICRFRPGERVRIQGTSLWAGHCGVFLRMLIPQRAVIDIDIFGRMVAIPIDDRDLELDISRRRRKRGRRRRGGGRLASRPADVAAALSPV